MPKPRKNQVCLDSTPYYHVMCRCVRRTYLCGIDALTGESYAHRRQWILDRMVLLSEVFTIEVCAYAIMSNHFHEVVYIDKEAALNLTDDEVIGRWTKLFSTPVLIQRKLHNQLTCEAEEDKCQEIISEWRERLYDLSWYMRCINEPLARMANKEDGCTGRFWEGRYKSQALLDESALLTCMTYVDLNPIRANMADTPESSDFTSIQARIRAHSMGGGKVQKQKIETNPQVPPLSKFLETEREDNPNGILFSYVDYLRLVDWTGRVIRDDKAGHIPSDVAPILERLNLDKDQWVDNIKYYGSRFRRVVGALDVILNYTQAINQQWCHGQSAMKQLYATLAA